MYTVETLIQELQQYDKNLQVAVWNHEEQMNNTAILLRQCDKRYEFTFPRHPEKDLDDGFLSIIGIDDI